MKRILLLVMVTALLSGCHKRLSPAPLSVGVDTTQMFFVPRLPLHAYDTISNQADKALQDELKYYMERHNVQDEGYEMVAAYQHQTDTLLALLPIQPIVTQDSLGHIIIGTYANDTLCSGVRLDSAGIYAGDFSGGKADGHGYYLSDGDIYYEGQWQNDQRNGFGFSVAPYSQIRVGQWKNDQYLGERMYYTSERIYGIDISRYQHGKGRKKYPISWDRLRITHLGKNQQHARGQVAYPVSFVFIKSTESTKIRNPYFFQDYTQARRHSIPVGAYHFFSCKTSGAAQAQHFINHTIFRKGDLPPVLDLEPYPSQIAAMGGPEAMFRHVRAWLTAVERYAHVKPILYVSQQFVNRYLGVAPDLKRNYQVWIARYGEYKPDVKLAVWQLSPNGRVNGIRGEVDINVFNGYRTQFEDFLKTETVR